MSNPWVMQIFQSTKQPHHHRYREHDTYDEDDGEADTDDVKTTEGDHGGIEGDLQHDGGALDAQRKEINSSNSNMMKRDWGRELFKFLLKGIFTTSVLLLGAQAIMLSAHKKTQVYNKLNEYTYFL